MHLALERHRSTLGVTSAVPSISWRVSEDLLVKLDVGAAWKRVLLQAQHADIRLTRMSGIAGRRYRMATARLQSQRASLNEHPGGRAPTPPRLIPPTVGSGR